MSVSGAAHFDRAPVSRPGKVSRIILQRRTTDGSGGPVDRGYVPLLAGGTVER